MYSTFKTKQMSSDFMKKKGNTICFVSEQEDFLIGVLRKE